MRAQARWGAGRVCKGAHVFVGKEGIGIYPGAHGEAETLEVAVELAQLLVHLINTKTHASCTTWDIGATIVGGL